MSRRAALLASCLLPALISGGAASLAAPAPDTAGKVAEIAKNKCKKGKKAAAVAKKNGKCKKTTPAAPAPAPSGTSAPAPPPPPPPPDTRTTDQKIDDAIARGEITAEQGLTYKVFASFGDPRLPSQFVGVPEALTEAPLDQVIEQWNQLSTGTQATLGPFLIPPMHAGSYWEQLISGTPPAATASPARAASRAAADPNSPWCTGGDVQLEDWHFVEALSGPAAGKVRIWYQDRYAATDSILAGNLMNVMTNKIWPALTALMGRDPLPDGGSTESCNGGSDAVDIALADASTATTYSNSLSSENTSTHMIFPRTLPTGRYGWAAFEPYLAHEFMHMIQYSYTLASGNLGSSENLWLKEGTAQWVQDYISEEEYGIQVPPKQTEQLPLDLFFDNPEKSLDSTDPSHHDYASYIFWLWAVRKANDPSLVRQVWNAVGTQKSLNAAKSLFGSGWDQAWKEFTQANWNQDPVTDYKNWDSITKTPNVESNTTLPSNTITPVITSVAPVAAKYLTFTPASDVNTLTYKNIGGLADSAGVQAIFTYDDGSHAIEDWTQVSQEDVPFCNVQSLTLVLSNASITAGDNRSFSLTFSPPGSGSAKRPALGPRAANVCIPNPQGSFSGTAHYDDGITTEVDWSWSGNVDFDPDGQINPWFPDYATEVWDNASVVSGSVTVSGTGTVYAADPVCTIDIPSQTFQYDPGGGTMIIQPGAQPHYGIDLAFPGNQLPQATFNCPGQDPTTGPIPAPVMVYTPDPEQAATRGTYQGSGTFANQFFNANYNWNLVDP